jgi:hypothetical protein
VKKFLVTIGWIFSWLVSLTVIGIVIYVIVIQPGMRLLQPQ